MLAIHLSPVRRRCCFLLVPLLLWRLLSLRLLFLELPLLLGPVLRVLLPLMLILLGRWLPRRSCLCSATRRPASGLARMFPQAWLCSSCAPSARYLQRAEQAVMVQPAKDRWQ